MKLNINTLNKSVWIDLDNSPHVAFFSPIIHEMQKKNYDLFITTRDCFQVCELANLHKLNYHNIGRHYGKYKILKLIGLLIRTFQLMPLVIQKKPGLSISHGSRSLIILSKLLNIPSILLMDYEWVTNFPRFLRPNWVIAPNKIPAIKLKRYGNKVLFYDGLKEYVYTQSFKPDASILKFIEIENRDRNTVLVTVRPPAIEAHYHNRRSDVLFHETLKYLHTFPNIIIVMLPRSKNQTNDIKIKWKQAVSEKKIIIPTKAVDGLSLMWYSDIVISGGGTMNREAASLGVPVYSIFGGKIGAIDQYLVQEKRLTILRNSEDIKKIKIMKKKSNTNKIKRNHVLNQILKYIDTNYPMAKL